MSKDLLRNHNIFGTFRPLSREQIKINALFVTLWSIPFIIIIAGVTFSVNSGNVWIGAAAGVIAIASLWLIASIRNVKYVYRFGAKYNLLRFVIFGSLVYSNVAWHGLLGIYNRLSSMEGMKLSISGFGWTVMSLSLVILLCSKLMLFREVNVSYADIIGLMECLALSILFGAIMFLILYS